VTGASATALPTWVRWATSGRRVHAYQNRDSIPSVKRQARSAIRSISDLRNKSQAIARFCRETGEPVFITKNGEGVLVVMSMAAWERERDRSELYALLGEAEADLRAGDRGSSIAAVRRRLRR
jgi:prevent-host-death family protein